MNRKKGIFVVLYGVNNIGKTTQLDLIEKMAQESGVKLIRRKYPVYELSPTGPRIHVAMKGGNPEHLSAEGIQELNAQNRRDFEPTLLQMLEENDVVLAEMYVGTSIAFGVADGVPRDYLMRINQDLLVPDLSLLLYGKRFKEAKEVGHRFEEDDTKMDQIAHLHDELSQEFGWIRVNANRDKQVIADELWQYIQTKLASP
jgi:thymidylate kinase